MNKTAIRNFAVWARVQLIEAAKQRAFEYEITEGGENRAGVDTIGGRVLTADEKAQRDKLIGEIRAKGYSQVMEEAAYTWFNRFIALRYMEVNGFLPSGVRMFTDENGAFKPEIMKEALSVDLEGLSREKVIDFMDKQDNEGLYKYLLITQCNALNKGLPYMFEKISNWTELLFPNNLLRVDNVVGKMISEIEEDDWKDAVQIIGWMYQFYNIEPKAKVFSRASGSKLLKEEIPAATQLFTPEWIVKYMVENSLGRLWYEGHRDEGVKANWKYYLDEAEQEPAVEAELQKIRTEYADVNPEEIMVIDPCMGSGHILVYAFDVLMQIYVSAGYTEREAAKTILEKNLYGLDIDDRAGQLAYFAVMMKARQYNRRILNGETKINVFAIQDSSFMSDDLVAFVSNGNIEIEENLIKLRTVFADAKEYGSLLSVPYFNFEALYDCIEKMKEYFPQNIFEVEYREIVISRLQQLVKQAEIMHQKYDVTITNPPYMAVSAAGPKLNAYVVKNYPDSKTDMFAVFIERCGQMLKKNGYQAMITMHSWMFLSSYETLRSKLLKKDTVSMAHLGARAFEEIAGEVVQTTAFVLRKSHSDKYKGIYCRLTDPNTQKGKEEMFLSQKNRFEADQSNFSKIPGSPIAYWVSDVLVSDFIKGTPFGNIGNPKVGMQTSNNDKFLRLWYEVDAGEFFSDSKKWIKYVKGGPYRKWYGNLDYVVWYNSTPSFILQQPHARVLPEDELKKIKCTWSDIATTTFACRTAPVDSFHDISGHCFYPKEDNYYYLLAFSNTCVFQQIINLLNSSIHYQTGDVARVPVLFGDKARASAIAENNIEASKEDWDSFETSWDFKKHPLV